VFGIGSGNSIAHGIGQKHWPPAKVRDYLMTLRSLFRGESAGWDGGTIKPMRCAQPVPVYYSAFGPQAMKVAGAAADGVILLIGSSLEKTKASIATVRDAAKAAGRNPDEVAIWAHTTISIAETKLEAMRAVAAYMATEVPMIAWSEKRMAAVPPHLKAAVLEAQRRYDVGEHGVEAGKNGRLIEELGLLEFCSIERTIAGTPDEVAGHLRELDRAGVQMLVHPMSGHRDPIGTVKRALKAAGRTVPETAETVGA
jgi:alkanesulfonate monooxygenase SsuD/methylene tetrahydromethanopterin reductase-like flavin-dependent oxidoreductase (luciferase family)